MSILKRVVTPKLLLQLELKLQAKMIPSLHKQGWFAEKTSDKFKAGRLDLRIGNTRYGQLDVELKYQMTDFAEIETTGLSKLQYYRMKDMNEHGMPAVGLVYVEPLDLFFVTTVLREALPPLPRRVVKLPGSEVISGPVLFVKALEYLDDLGYRFNITRHGR